MPSFSNASTPHLIHGQKSSETTLLMAILTLGRKQDLDGSGDDRPWSWYNILLKKKKKSLQVWRIDKCNIQNSCILSEQSIHLILTYSTANFFWLHSTFVHHFLCFVCWKPYRIDFFQENPTKFETSVQKFYPGFHSNISLQMKVQLSSKTWCISIVNAVITQYTSSFKGLWLTSE